MSRYLQLCERGLVPLAGVEPALLAELDFESSASTNSATGAQHMIPKSVRGFRTRSCANQEARRTIAAEIAGSTHAGPVRLRPASPRSRGGGHVRPLQHVRSTLSGDGQRFVEPRR